MTKDYPYTIDSKSINLKGTFWSCNNERTFIWIPEKTETPVWSPKWEKPITITGLFYRNNSQLERNWIYCFLKTMTDEISFWEYLTKQKNPTSHYSLTKSVSSIHRNYFFKKLFEMGTKSIKPIEMPFLFFIAVTENDNSTLTKKILKMTSIEQAGCTYD